MYRWIKIFFWSYLFVLLIGCSGINFTEWHIPYMMKVQQGNYITNSQFNQLKPGMTKGQVAFIIGQPLTQFMFDQNRWDFIYQNYKNKQLTQSYDVTVYFNNESQVINITKVGKLFNQ